MSHCPWCADAWRSVLIGLISGGIRSSTIARHYGLRPTTVVETAAEARRHGCLAPPRCLHCPKVVTRVGGLCGSRECRRTYGRDYMRKRRTTGVIGKGLGRQDYGAPEGFVWPVLPENPRERSIRVPRVKLTKPSGMVLPLRVQSTSISVGVLIVGGGRTSPIGTLSCGRLAA